MNKAFLIGRLTQDPQASTLDSGHSYCRFSIAVNRTFGSRDGESKADFINIVTWDGLAQNCVKYLVKGSQVAVTGSIQTGKLRTRRRKTYYVRSARRPSRVFVESDSRRFGRGSASPS